VAFRHEDGRLRQRVAMTPDDAAGSRRYRSAREVARR
jgi:hypothetical protein